MIPPHPTLDAVAERLIGTRFRSHLIALALLGSWSKSAQGQQAAWKTYVDTLSYQIRGEFHTLSLTDGRLRTEVYRFDTCEHQDTALTIDPLYVAHLSGGGNYYLLILGSILDQPGVPIETVRSIVATIRRVGEQRR
jgi:hypothetical protein